MLTDDDKSLIKDMLKTEGWRLFEALNKKAVENYRLLAVQPPGAVADELRTWYAALAAGREEALAEIQGKVL